jgi:competence protein ComEA
MLLRLVTALGLAVLAAGCEDDRPSPKAPPSVSPLKPLDLNTATVAQLEALPAIGPKLARSIIASRNARGGRFTRVEELLAIDGIGHNSLDRIRLLVSVEP